MRCACYTIVNVSLLAKQKLCNDYGLIKEIPVIEYEF